METFWETNVRELLHFFMIIIIILGFIGNTMSFKVFSSQTLKKHPISIYFRFRSIFDLIMVINGVFYFIAVKFSYNVSRANDFFCKFKDYLVYTNGAISTWLIVVVSLDRFICIRFPKRFSFCYKLKFQLTVIFTLIMYNYLFYSFMTWNSVLVTVNGTETDDIKMKCKTNYDVLVLELMDLFNSTVIPFTAIFILSIVLIYYVRLSRIRVHGSNARHHGGSCSSNNSRLKRDNRLAVSVISINFLFFALNLPIVIYDLINPDAPSSKDLIDYTMQVLYYAYYSINFYAQIVVNTEFRNELLRLMNLKAINLPPTVEASTVNTINSGK